MVNDEALISVVVPVYNVQEFVGECIESIIGQTYSRFELLLIDDGSTDNSGQICEEYKNRDSRIQVYHKMNGGLSDARNYGIERAHGEYITFIDSDDVVSVVYLERLLDIMISTDSDLVQGAFTRTKDSLSIRKHGKVSVYEHDEAFRNYLKRENLYVSACAKLFKTVQIKDILFPIGVLNEDNFTTYKYIYRASKCACTDIALYWHRINRDSIMQSAFSEKKLSVKNVPDEIATFLGEEKKKYQTELDYYTFRLNISIYNRMMVLSSKDEFLSEKNETLNKIIKYEFFKIPDLKFKIVAILLRYFKPIYIKMIYKMYKRGKIS